MTKNVAATSYSMSATGTGGTFNSWQPSGGASAFQLPSGNYVNSQITMEVASPRPDVERTTNSRYSYAYPGIEFEVPITIIGGSYPFHYEITSRSGTADTANATIGESRTYDTDRSWYGSANQKDYGVLRWTPDGSDDTKTYSFTVRVTGQDGVFVDAVFSGTVDTAKFIFVEDGVVSGTGTLASPFEDNSDWWGVDGSDATYAGKFVYYKAGTYEAFPSSQFNSNKPLVYMPHPDAASRPIFTGTTKDYSFASTGMDDFWWQGFYINGTPATAVAQCRFFEFGTSANEADRLMMWDNYFYNGEVGSTANDNNGWIIMLNAAVKQYTSIVSNTFDTANSSSNGFNACTFFDVEKFVIEHNVVTGFTGETTFQCGKDDTNTWSLRANDMWESNSSHLYIRNQDVASRSFDQEVCWNWIQATGNPAVFWNAQKGSAIAGPLYCYRNTLASINDTAAFKMSVYDSVSPTETLSVIKNVSLSITNPNISAQLDVTGSTDAEMNTWLTNGTFDNTWYDSDTQTEVNMTTGVLQNGGLSVSGTYGAEVNT